VELLERWRQARFTAGSAATAEVEQHVEQLMVLLMAARSYSDVVRRREEKLGPVAAIFERDGVPYEKEASEPIGKIRAAVERTEPPRSGE
jgi:hypothetical protein